MQPTGSDDASTTSDEDILLAAVALPSAERSAYLERTCRGNSGQRARIAALLQGHDDARDFLRTPAVQRAMATLAEKPGDEIDGYKLLQRIGEGGCGVVWYAQQKQPLRRKVALKIIKLGMDTKAVVTRFEAERQALAMMDHPNIARVFDAGVTGTGRPYFVMELVRGLPITKYCDQHHYTTARRLELFISVCEALQHAHQKGIIHRDLKPSNILVTESGGIGVPKVIDFGIAKAIQGRLSDDSVFTAFEQFIGTPNYMSPEQADMSSLDVDTRSDVYSLGVLLFELLTGRLPFDAHAFLSGGVDQVRQRIRESEPAKPSARLGTLPPEERTTLARLRGSVPHQLSLQLRGDVDWIVLRCLEKDRTRRYDTASALAADIRRHLRHEPVVARPPGRLYVARKLIRRHRAGFIATATVVAVLVLGGTFSTWQAIRATRAEHAQSSLRVRESVLRQRAETQELAARRRAYAADMKLLQQALQTDNLGLAKSLLDRQRPGNGEVDLRGWEWRYLWQLCQSEAAATITRKPHPVPSLSISSDGSWLAVGQDDGGEISVWNLRTRHEIRMPAGVGAVRAVFSPTVPLLAIAYNPARDSRWDSAPFGPPRDARREYRLRLWNLTTRQTVTEWDATGAPGPMFFSADGATLVTAGGVRTSQIQRWRVPTGEKLGELAASGGATLAVTGDLRLAAREVQRNGRAWIQVFDLASGEERWSVDGSEDSISALAFSADGTVLASAAGYSEDSIRLWDAVTGKPRAVLEGHHTVVAALTFWPDGETLASAGKDQTVRLWDLKTHQLLRTFRGHELEVHSLALLPDKTSLVSGAKDGAVLLWDTAARPVNPLIRLHDPVTGWRFARDSRAIVTLDSAGHLARRTGPEFADSTPLMDIGEVPRGPQRVAFAREQPLVAVASEAGEVRIYDWEKRSLVQALQTREVNPAIVGFRNAGQSLLLAYPGRPPANHTLHEWEIAAGAESRSWHPADAAPMQFTLSPDAQRCVIRGADGAVSLLDFSRGTGARLFINAAQASSAGISPDGTLFAGSSGVGWVKVWNLDTGKQVASLSGFVLGVHSATFSPDGARLVTGSGGDEAVRVWDVATFDPLITLGAQGSRFASTSVSPDGNLIGSRNSSGRLHVWRAPSAAEIEAAENAGPR
jgi:serine/threonine protein kinase/WD40 repeat protein